MNRNPVRALAVAAAAAVVLAGAGGRVAARTPPRRAASANLCADQLLLALADPGQIAFLSPFAADSSQSFLAAAARRFPRSGGSAEDIVARRADLVLTGPYDSRATRDLLAASGVDFEVIAPWRTLEDGYAQIRALAARLGHRERGETLIAAIRAALAHLDAATALRRKTAPSAVVLGRGGYVFVGGALWEILRRTGLRDAARELGLSASGFAQLEALAAARPDYVIVTGAGRAPHDEGEAFLQHPALQTLYPPQRRLFVPERLMQCDGPSTPALIDAVAAQAQARLAGAEPSGASGK